MNVHTLIFGLGQVLFFAFMWTSKNAHVLFFEKHSAMLNFGASYTAMAAAGYTSFYVGYLADRIGFRRVLTIGAALYSAGLFLRAYPANFSVAVASGLLSGLGASAVLCGLRLWMLELSNDTNTAKMVGLKSSTASLGTALGCIAIGVVPTILASTDSLQWLLQGSAAGVFTLALVFFVLAPRDSHSRTSTTLTKRQNFKELFYSSKGLFFGVLALGVMTGFYVSFMSPYLPLIMKDKGLSLMSIGLSTASLALIRTVADPLTARLVEQYKDRALQLFLGAEVLLTLVTASLLWTLSKEAFLLVLIARSTMLGISTISEEVLWIRTFPKNAVGMLFGLNQTGFFIGDSIGGITNGFLYQRFGLEVCIFVVLIIMLVNAIAFFRFFARRSELNLQASAVKACG